jgi:membrane protease YdiL (CAAX protease family)
MGCFTVLVVASSFALTWLRMRSGSVWPAVLAHAAHNAFVQGAFDPLAIDSSASRILLGEFGLALPLAAGVAGFCFWIKRAQLSCDQLTTGPFRRPPLPNRKEDVDDLV